MHGNRLRHPAAFPARTPRWRSRACCWWRRCRAISRRCCATTVRTMLPEHDVYITDWHNARDVRLDDGRFGFDDYVEHLIRFLEAIGPARTSSRCASPASPRWSRRA